MIDELEEKGEMETIIKQACELSEEAHSDFGRGGKRGFQAFINLTRENAEEDQKGASFRQSLNARLNASEEVSSALERELTRRFPVHLRWDRKADSGPTVKTIANRMTYVTGEILRRYAK